MLILDEATSAVDGAAGVALLCVVRSALTDTTGPVWEMVCQGPEKEALLVSWGCCDACILKNRFVQVTQPQPSL